MNIKDIKKTITIVHDYPIPGIIFRDITTLLEDPEAFKATVDIMYSFPHGKEELEGVENRTDFDLGSHTKNQEDFSISSEVMKNKKLNIVFFL